MSRLSEYRSAGLISQLIKRGCCRFGCGRVIWPYSGITPQYKKHSFWSLYFKFIKLTQPAILVVRIMLLVTFSKKKWILFSVQLGNLFALRFIRLEFVLKYPTSSMDERTAPVKLC
jgi:hypothetical protein